MKNNFSTVELYVQGIHSYSCLRNYSYLVQKCTS